MPFAGSEPPSAVTVKVIVVASAGYSNFVRPASSDASFDTLSDVAAKMTFIRANAGGPTHPPNG